MHALEAEMRRLAESNNIPIIAPESALKLSEIISATKPRRILEIGAAIGYSALLMLEAGREDAKVTTIEIDPERAALARSFIQKAGETGRIELIEGDAGAILKGLSGSYDFVFLDGPMGQYLRQLKDLLPEKLAEQAVIVADNVAFRGMVNGEEPCLPRYKTIVLRLREYIAFVSSNPHFKTEIFTEADHLAISYYSKELKENA